MAIYPATAAGPQRVFLFFYLPITQASGAIGHYQRRASL